MENNIEEAINEFVSERTSDILNDIMQDDEVIKQTEAEMEIVKSIRELLPDDHKELVIKLTDSISYKSVKVGDIIYKNGLRDGIKIGENFL